MFQVREQLSSGQGASFDTDSYAATSAVAEEIDAGSADLNVLFVSSGHELTEVERACREAGPGPTLCCTTAGEPLRPGGKRVVVAASVQWGWPVVRARNRVSSPKVPSAAAFSGIVLARFGRTARLFGR